jgi:hypothetical protein
VHGVGPCQRAGPHSVPPRCMEGSAAFRHKAMYGGGERWTHRWQAAYPQAAMLLRPKNDNVVANAAHSQPVLMVLVLMVQGECGEWPVFALHTTGRMAAA